MANGDDKDDRFTRILRTQRSKDRPDPVADAAKAAGSLVAEGGRRFVELNRAVGDTVGNVVTRPYNPRTQAIIDKLTPSYEGATPEQIEKARRQTGVGLTEKALTAQAGAGTTPPPSGNYTVGSAIPADVLRKIGVQVEEDSPTPVATPVATPAATPVQPQNFLAPIAQGVKGAAQGVRGAVMERGEKLLDALQKTKEKPEPEPEKDRFTDVRDLLKQGVGTNLRRQDFASADAYAQAIRQAAGTEAPLGTSSPLRQTPRELGRLSGAMNRAGRRLIRKGAARQGFAMFGQAEAQRLNEGSAISTPESRARQKEEDRQRINLIGATQQRMRDYQNLRNQMGTGVQGAPQGLFRTMESNIPQAGSPTSNIRQSPMNKRFGL